MSGDDCHQHGGEYGGTGGKQGVRITRKAGEQKVKIRPAAAPTSHQCRQCRQQDDRFYCDPCLNSLIRLHNHEIDRLTLARDKAQSVVQHLLGQGTELTPDLPDPFDSQAQSTTTSLLLLQLIRLRAQVAAGIYRIQDVHMCISQSQQVFLKGKEKLKEKRVQILQRKQNLAKAWSSLEGSSRSISKLPAWTTDVYTQYERNEPAVSADESRQLGAIIASTRLSVSSLQREAKSVSMQLKAMRTTLVHQALSLYAVSPPHSNSMAAAVPASHRRREELSASSFVAQRFSKLSERYMPGAFVFHQDNDRNQSGTDAALGGGSSGGGSANWTISGLALPLPSEVRRHSRESVNGALAYTVHLLQLLAGYLGMALPFSLVVQKGKLSVRPDPLWDGGGGSSAKPLQISSAAYTFLTAAAPTAVAKPSKLNNLAESTLGLGASTLSTIESYIQLPSSASIPWGLTSVGNAREAKSPEQGESQQDNQRSLNNPADVESSSPSTAASANVKPDHAAKAFVSGLVMLSYNVAYLASKQGVKIDLVTAASNPLQLLHLLLTQAELGSQSHASHVSSNSINDLSMPHLDYEQLAQVLEPTGASMDSTKKNAKRTAAKPVPRTSSSRPAKILEQSYIDAGAAAASVLDIADPSKLPKPTSPQRHPSVAAKSTLRPHTDHRGRHLPVSTPPPPPPTSLTFLRQRGRDATKPSDVEQAKAPSPKRGVEPPKVGPGAVIFNGVEVGVGNVVSVDTFKRTSKARADVEEGWNLV